ncbi:rhodanese-like domain-containing protein [Pasteurellaceae bacterium LIM206]|nr:rhodanese-like domain-containing protein [Pasteurellaceae bacterium LIM206]
MQDFMPLAVQFAKNHTLLIAAWVAIFLMVVYQLFQAATVKVKLISNAQATSLINNQDAVVIDLRSPDEFKHGHIAGSQQFLPTDIKTQNLGKLEHHKDTPVILVCANGAASRTSANILAKNKFSRVYVLNEGIAGWKNANLPLVK